MDARALRLPRSQPRWRPAVTHIERDGEPLAVLVHDPAVQDDPDLVDAVAAAARLAALLTHSPKPKCGRKPPSRAHHGGAS